MSIEFGSKRFLVVDNFGKFRDLLRSLIQLSGGKEIEIAVSGEEALTKLNKAKFDIVLCEHQLGEGISGQQVLEQAREQKLLDDSAIFLMVTEEGGTAASRSTSGHKPDGYLLKPFNQAMLVARIEKILQEKESLSPIYAAIAANNIAKATEECKRLAEAMPQHLALIKKIEGALLFDVSKKDAAENLAVLQFAAQEKKIEIQKENKRHTNSNDLSFTDVLASSVRDMSNSLGIITSILERAQSINFNSDASGDTRSGVADLLYEATRVHSDLLHIYQLYQLDNGLYQPIMDECNVHDFITEQVAQDAMLLKTKNIKLNIDGPKNLLWAFDQQLLHGLIQNCLTNTARYTKDAISLKFAIDHDYLVIYVEDNSEHGYPKHAFVSKEDCQKGFELPAGNIGLSIYYAVRIAKAHRNRAWDGFITVDNESSLGGGRIGIYLP